MLARRYTTEQNLLGTAGDTWLSSTSNHNSEVYIMELIQLIRISKQKVFSSSPNDSKYICSQNPALRGIFHTRGHEFTVAVA